MTAAATACLVVGSTACDTGDGKQLRPVDPDTTSTSTTTIVDGSLDTGPLPSIPIDGAEFGTLPGPAASDGASGDGLELFTPWIGGDPIDERYTCDGDDISPPLSWTSPPDGTVELAFVVTDESTFIETEPFVHWVVAGVDPAEVSLLENEVPAGAVQALNSLGTVGWRGPCPPAGDPAHVYRFTVYALNQQVELADGTAASELLDYIERLAVASTEVTATYQR